MSTPFFDDISKLAGSAANAMMDMKREVETMVAAHVEKLLGKMNFVTREEFEAVKAMAAKAREENDALKSRLDTMERR